MYHKLWIRDILKNLKKIESKSNSNGTNNSNNNNSNNNNDNKLVTRSLFFGEWKEPITHIRVLGYVVEVNYIEGNKPFTIFLDDSTDIVTARLRADKHSFLIQTKKLVVGSLVEIFGSLNEGKVKQTGETLRFIDVRYIQFKQDDMITALRDLEIIQNYKNMYFKSMNLLGAQSYSRKKENLLVETDQDDEDMMNLLELDDNAAKTTSNNTNNTNNSNNNNNNDTIKIKEALNRVIIQSGSTGQSLSTLHSKVSRILSQQKVSQSQILQILEDEIGSTIIEKDGKYFSF